MPSGCEAGGPATEAAEKLLHLLALLKLNLVQRKVSGWAGECSFGACQTLLSAFHHTPICSSCRLNAWPPSFPPSQVLVFVNSAEGGMRVRLFLEAFGVRAALLNAELPLNSRHHILQVGAALWDTLCGGSLA